MSKSFETRLNSIERRLGNRRDSLSLEQRRERLCGLLRVLSFRAKSDPVLLERLNRPEIRSLIDRLRARADAAETQSR